MFEEYFEKYRLSGAGKTSRKRIRADKKAVLARVGAQDGAARAGRPKSAVRFAVCIAAAACLTVTAGALGYWTFSQNVFGGNTEVMNKYVIMPDSFEIVENTFKNCDIEVSGLASDEHLFYIAVDFTAKNGAKMSELAGRLHQLLKMDQGGYGMGSSEEWQNVSEESATLFTSVDITSAFTGCGSFFLYSSDDPASAFDPSECEEYAEIRLNFNGESVESVTADFTGEFIMPVVELRNGLTSDWPHYEQEWYAERISVSGISVAVEGRSPYIYGATINPDCDRIYLLLDDGTRAEIKYTGSGGRVIDGNTHGKTVFMIKQPVNVGEIKAVVFGDTEITLK